MVVPCCGSAPAMVLGVSLGQHFAQQEQKLLQNAQDSAVAAAVPFMSHGKGKGFSLSPPCSARGSSGRNWSSLLLWICRHAHALEMGTRQPRAMLYLANWVCFISIVRLWCWEFRGQR